MGFLSELGKGFKDITEGIGKEIGNRQEAFRTKNKILARFEISDLKGICNAYGIGEPEPYDTDILTGRRTKIKVERSHYINRIIYKLTLDQIRSYAEKHRVKISDLLSKEKDEAKPIQEVEQKEEKQVTTIQIKRQSEFDSILESIKEEFEPIDVRDEIEFEKQLTQFLRIKFKDSRIERQVETPKGRIDIVIDNKYALELKIAESKNILRNLIGQIHDYKKVYDNVAIVLLDPRKLSPAEIKEYCASYESQGATTLIIEGTARRKKGKSREIKIRL